MYCQVRGINIKIFIYAAPIINMAKKNNNKTVFFLIGIIIILILIILYLVGISYPLGEAVAPHLYR